MKRIGLGSGKLIRVLDKLTFGRILVLWVFMVIFFGLVYYCGSDHSQLVYTRTGQRVALLSDAVYFSFITATTTGFGDITPLGLFKAMAVLEVVCGLLLLAVVTSKLVYLKQDMILDEVYELSFYEKIGRLRTSFSLFRQSISRIIEEMPKGEKSRLLFDTGLQLSLFDYTLQEVEGILLRKNELVKSLDAINAELFLN
ncbi:MAG: potassium channel family protein, partial [Candidatus Woesearchaeota archaeon]